MATEQKILLIEDNPGDTRLIQEMLAEVKVASFEVTSFEIECLDSLLNGLKRLERGGIDLVLLDLLLPDSHGLETFTSVYSRAPGVPIIVLSCLNDEVLAVEAVRKGAQDYLVKGQFDGNLLVRSICYAIERKRTEEQLKESLNNLRETLEGVIQATAVAVKMKDPYTAGHQLRVAQLACAIAKEMGLSEEKINEINMAAMVHGLLRTIDFPWTTVLTALQHHDRISNSGLSGKDILLGARILCVADVVEATTSHRPYRPALGIQKALEEISRNKGILYDHDVVVACLRVLKKGFDFK